MNRTIKFRGKRTDTGEWVYGYYFKDMTDGRTYHVIGETPLLAHEIDKETVGQFTGLLDAKNNNCIFEGDILSLSGIKIGNCYESKDLLKTRTNIVIKGLCTKTWISTYQEAIKRGCNNAE